jgi:small-conductance mechanosensitive channel
MADNATPAPFEWSAAIDETFSDLSQQFVQYFPQLLGTATLLLFGYALARMLALSARKLVEGLDALFVRLTHTQSVDRERLQRSYALIISKLVFWVVMLFFFAVGANVLGWDLFSGWLDRIVGYVPGLVTGLLIILGGFLLSNIAHTGVITAAQRAALEQSAIMARAVQIVIIFSAIIIGVEQIGLNIGFLSNLIVVVVAILLAGAALAFSLGARDLVANVIGAQYTRRHCRVGDHLRIGAVAGEIIEVAQASIVVATPEGKAVIPAKQFHEEVCFITPAQNHQLKLQEHDG